MKCLVFECANHQHQGKFVGNLCAPCHHMLTTGETGHGATFVHGLEGDLRSLHANLRDERAQHTKSSQTIQALTARVRELEAERARMQSIEAAARNLRASYRHDDRDARACEMCRVLDAVDLERVKSAPSVSTGLKPDGTTRAVEYNAQWAALHCAFTLPLPTGSEER